MSIFLGGIGAVNRMTAKTKRNQTALNKAIYWGMEYFKVSDERDRAYNNDNDRRGRALDIKSERTFDTYQKYLEMLPKAEQKKVEKYNIENYNN
jgi:vacuolar-type H+-ATPase subunit B/Vma2